MYVPPRGIPDGIFQPPVQPIVPDDAVVAADEQDRPFPASTSLHDILIEPVLCSLTGDFPARSHLTNWQLPHEVNGKSPCEYPSMKGEGVKYSIGVVRLSKSVRSKKRKVVT